MPLSPTTYFETGRLIEDGAFEGPSEEEHDL
jgi:hypothetical protein